MAPIKLTISGLQNPVLATDFSGFNTAAGTAFVAGVNAYPFV
jgi:hypothetical protein